MNKIIITCLMILSLSMAKAQYVLIPDSIFRQELITLGYGSCFDTTQTMLDTTCSSVLAATELIVAHKFIRSIEGAQYFKNLTHLDCDGNHIDSIPCLPPLLRYFDCSANYIEKIVALPGSLDTLDCYFNHLDSLPALPNTLSYLYCAVNKITTLPPLPSSLATLICYGNLLDSLPALPGSLSYLNCEGNSLVALPGLPNALTTLDCERNSLTSLPILPATVTYLDCSYNQLSSLPALPDSMTSFNCSNNYQLNCLPTLNKIGALLFDSTAITCLPNNPSDNTEINPPNVPICTAPCYPSGVLNVGSVSILIYPNPVSDILYVDYPTQNLVITIHDMTGRVLTVPITYNIVDVSALPSGLYLLGVQSSNGGVVGKFIKE